MSLTPIPNATSSLNKLFYLDPKKEALSNKVKECLLKTAAIVICIAAFAIAATALTFSLLATAGAVAPIVLTLSSLGVVPLSWVAAKIWNFSASYKNLADIEYSVEKIQQNILPVQENQISDNREETVLQILKQFNITPSEDTLRQLSDSSPNKSLPPAILYSPLLARLKYWIEKTATHHVATIALLSNLKSTDSAANRTDTYEKALQNQQANTLRAALNAAIMLEIIDRPFTTEPSQLNHLGTAEIKPALACLLDLQCIKENTYFTLRQENAKPVSFGELQAITEELVENYLQYMSSEAKDFSKPFPFVAQLNMLRELLFRPALLNQKTA